MKNQRKSPIEINKEDDYQEKLFHIDGDRKSVV